jgi:hypothetical protein
MWYGFDPDTQRQLLVLRQMVARQRQTPSREWPLVFLDEYDQLLVVREWPDGALTAYTTSEYSDPIRNRRQS